MPEVARYFGYERSYEMDEFDMNEILK